MKVLFCVSGIGRGHASRCRPLVEALVARGETCCAAVLGRRAADLLVDLCPVLRPPDGFHRRVAPVDLARFAFISVYDLDMALSYYQRSIGESTRASAEFVAEALDAVAPDVVVVDQITTAGAIARARGLPVVQITHPPLVPDHGPWIHWTSGRDPAFVYPPALPAVNAALGTVGVAPLERVEDQLGGELFIFPTHPALGTLPGAVHVRQRSTPAASARSAPGRPAAPVIGVALGVSGAIRLIAEEVLEGALATGGRVLCLDGEGLSLPDRLRREERLRVLERVRMEDVLPSCDAVVHHGGSGTVNDCLAAGVPSVSVPTHTEQEYNARRLAALGGGAVVPVSGAALEPEELRPGLVSLVHRRPRTLSSRVTAALATVSEDRVRDRVHALRAEGRRLPEVADAADRVRALAALAA